MNETPPTPTPQPKSNLTLILVIVALVAIALVAIGYYLSANKVAAPEQTNQPAATSPTDGNEPAAVPVPSEIFAYVGEVTAVSSDALTVLAKPVVNYLDKDTVLTVKADANTQIIKRTIPKTLPQEGGTDLFKQENIKLSEVNKGDQVTVVSPTNIKDKTEFTASRIEVMEIK